MTHATHMLAHPKEPPYGVLACGEEWTRTDVIADDDPTVTALLAQLNAGCEADEDLPRDDESAEDTHARLSVYQEITDRLVVRGIPRAEIAWIHDAKTPSDREALFTQVRRGTVRVLLGSTFRMGVGVNIQERCYAVHHLTTPWRPCDVKQADGRIWRPGNLFPEVWIFRYIASPSFDGFSWQGIETKGRFEDAYLRGDPEVREMKDIDEQIISAGEIKALASGDPRIVQKVRLEHELDKLTQQRNGWEGTRRNAYWQLERRRDDAERQEKQVRVLATYRERCQGDKILILAGTTYDLTNEETHRTAGKEIRDAIIEWAYAQSILEIRRMGYLRTSLGTYRNVPVYAQLETDKDGKITLPHLFLTTDQGERLHDYRIYISDLKTIVSRFDQAIFDIAGAHAQAMRQAAYHQAKVDEIEEQVKEKWEHERTYRLMELGLRYLNAVLNDNRSQTEAVITEVMALAESEGLDIDAITAKGQTIEEKGIDLSTILVQMPAPPMGNPARQDDPPPETSVVLAPRVIAATSDYDDQMPDDVAEASPNFVSLSFHADPLPIARPTLEMATVSLKDMAVEAARKKAEIANQKKASAAGARRTQETLAGQNSMFD